MADVAEGGCLCGTVRYRIAGTPLVTSRCHCRSCRLASGAAAVAWIVLRRADVAFTAGQPLRRRSSPPVVRSFCAICGTALAYEHDDDPGAIELTAATLDDPARFAPAREIWLEHRLPWTPLDPALAHHAKDSDAPALPPALRSIDIKAFVPAREFQLSLRFYEALGFAVERSDGEIALLRNGASSFLLQRFYVAQHADNFMMSLRVADVDAWWRHVEASDLVGRFGGRAEPPADRPWGMRAFPLIDPSGVLWWVGQPLDAPSAGADQASTSTSKPP